MNSHYVVQTIPHNLTKEETIVQMVEILDHLNAITQDVFSRVNKRLELNSEKLSDISKRIESAATKLDNLKGDKKAKTVFSSSKYPAVDVNRDYISIFKEPSKVERKRHEVKYGKYLSTHEPLSKLQFYHVKMPDQKNVWVPEGLGEIPGDIMCINDLLLFNTGRNVYKNFKPGDSLRGPDIVGNKDNYATSELGPAPLSISQRSSMQQTNKDNYSYTPQIEELPALDVPWDLPDLPGIADDVRYETDATNSSIIAPSVINNQLPDLDLPDITEIKEIPDVVSQPPLPPPPQHVPEPPPMQLPTNTHGTGHLESKLKVTSTELPDTVVDSVPKQELPIQPPPPPTVPVPQNDSRASLMDAIRKAGGSANLKKTSEHSQVSGGKTTSSSGDLMADLHSKLMMRRKGISGSKQVDQENNSNLGAAESAFAKISSIIPPPTKGSDVGSSVSTDDEAWNDDDDA